MSDAAAFDFLRGRWTVTHHRLAERGVGSNDWRKFEGTAENRPLLGGLCNVEEHLVPGEDFGGTALRTFSRSTRRWSIYWVSELDGVLGRPVVGGFSGETGVFEGADHQGDAPVEVRFTWHRIDASTARWTQSFSYDRGRHWETNWIMEFRRSSGPSE